MTQLRYVVAVADTQHFAEAAARCQVTQPTLSMQIQKLERNLGVEVFDRSKKPVAPTDIGQAVIAQARRVLHESEQLCALVHEAKGRMTGELRLGIIPTLAPYLLPTLAPRFAARYPEIHLKMHERTTAQLMQELGSSQLDAALVSDHAAGSSVISRPLFREQFVAFVSPQHPLSQSPVISPRTLRREDVWLLSEGHCFREQVLELCREQDLACGVNRSLHFESGNLETLIKLVKGSGGMTLLPYLAARELSDTDTRTYVRTLEPSPNREVNLVSNRSYYKQNLIRAFVRVLTEVLPDSVTRVG